MTRRYECIRKQQPDAVLDEEIFTRSCSEQGVKVKIPGDNALLILKGEYIRDENGVLLQHVFRQKIADRIIWIDPIEKWIVIVEMKKGYTGSLSDLLEKFTETAKHTANILSQCDEHLNQYKCSLYLVYIKIPGEFIKKLSQKPYVSIEGRKCVINLQKHTNGSYWELSDSLS
jgi:hypothetical protein